MPRAQGQLLCLGLHGEAEPGFKFTFPIAQPDLEYGRCSSRLKFLRFEHLFERTSGCLVLVPVSIELRPLGFSSKNFKVSGSCH